MLLITLSEKSAFCIAWMKSAFSIFFFRALRVNASSSWSLVFTNAIIMLFLLRLYVFLYSGPSRGALMRIYRYSMPFLRMEEVPGSKFSRTNRKQQPLEKNAEMNFSFEIYCNFAVDFEWLAFQRFRLYRVQTKKIVFLRH